MRKLIWDLKSIRFYALVPPVILLGAFPLYLFLIYTLLTPYDPSDTAEIVERAQELIPFLSIWWSTFILREQLEAEGSEVFSLYLKSRIPQTGKLLLAYLLLVALLFAGLFCLFDGMLPLFLLVLIETVFLYTLDFFLIFLLKSTTFAMLAVVLYTAAMFILPPQQIGWINIFSQSGATPSLPRIGVMLALSVFFTAGGSVVSRWFYR